jgi:branched-chain amino acid transport system substrate-binding protein
MTQKLTLAMSVAFMASVALLSGSKAADSEAPIKVAFLAIDSGPFANSTEANVKGVKLAVDYLNSQAGGPKFEVVIENDDGTPASAIVAATRAVQQDGAKYILGMFTSSIAAALVPKAAALGAIVIDPWSQSDDLIGKSCGPNFFRTSTSNSMIVNSVKAFVKQSGVKAWDVISVDYASGHDLAAKFDKFLAESGGKINVNLFEPLGTNDFGSYISQLAASPSEGLLVTIFGSDATAFAKQQAQFGLFKKYKLVLGNGFTNPPTIGAQGETVLGVNETLSYDYSLPNAKNQAFVKAYSDRYKDNPSYSDADIYVALELLKSAISQANSTDVAAVKSALAGLKLDTVYGEVELRAADHQLVRPELITEVVRDGQGNLTFGVKESLDGALIMPAPNPQCKL